MNIKCILLIGLVLSVQNAFSETPYDYQSWSAAEKQAYLWDEKIVPSEWERLPELTGLGWGGILKSLKSLFALSASFDHISDELPEGRTKILHPYGSVALIELVPRENNGLTGIYQGGIGLARLSLGGDPTKLGYTPGMAVKFLIDGQPSVNFHVMDQLNGQGENQNFFEYTFSNIVPEPTGLAFNVASSFLGLFVDDPLHLNIPEGLYQIFFEPTEQVQIDPDTDKDFREELALIPEGTILYKVWGTVKPGAEPVFIGDLVTRSRFVSSHYGDHFLFFQHQR